VPSAVAARKAKAQPFLVSLSSADQASLAPTGLKQTFIDPEFRLARDSRSELLPHPFGVFWLQRPFPLLECGQIRA